MALVVGVSILPVPNHPLKLHGKADENSPTLCGWKRRGNVLGRAVSPAAAA